MRGYAYIKLLSKVGYEISGCCIADTEYHVVWSQISTGNIVSQPDGDMLGHESYLNLSARFRFLEHKFSSGDISNLEIQNLPNSETTAGLKFQNQAVSNVLRVEDDFIHGLLVQDLTGSLLNVLERLKQLRNAARVLDVHLECVDDEIKEGSQLSISEAPGGPN